MTDKQRAALLESMWADLHKTEHGWTEGNGGGVHWGNAERKHQELRKDLLASPPSHSMVFPIANPDFHVITGALHETDGLPGYWAIDFICKAGLGIVAVESGVITRFSGHDPSDDAADAAGVFGWSTYFRTSAGYSYFLTHQGRRYPTLRPGMSVKAGDLIGFVGDQRFRPDHVHYAVHSPKSEADAKAHITAVSKAPKVS